MSTHEIFHCLLKERSFITLELISSRLRAGGNQKNFPSKFFDDSYPHGGAVTNHKKLDLYRC